jgi:hypothetical protein
MCERINQHLGHLNSLHPSYRQGEKGHVKGSILSFWTHELCLSASDMKCLTSSQTCECVGRNLYRRAMKVIYLDLPARDKFSNSFAMSVPWSSQDCFSKDRLFDLTLQWSDINGCNDGANHQREANTSLFDKGCWRGPRKLWMAVFW